MHFNCRSVLWDGGVSIEAWLQSYFCILDTSEAKQALSDLKQALSGLD